MSRSTKTSAPRATRRPPGRRRRATASAPAGGPGPARLFGLAAGALLTLLGVLGFFYDAGFATGADLDADDIAGVLVVNGWRNVIYLLSGLLALGFAGRRPRATATALGAFYLGFGIWGLLATKHGIGSILDFLPLADRDNAFHLALGVLGLLAALVDGPLPRMKRAPRSGPGGRRRRPAARRSGGGGEAP